MKFVNYNNNNSVHITLFKEKESLSKRFLNNNILLILNNFFLFFNFLKIHAKFFNLTLLISNIFIYSLKFYYIYNNKFNLNFYKHYFFTYFNRFFFLLKKKILNFNKLIDTFFLEFLKEFKTLRLKKTRKKLILYNYNLFLIGKNFNYYTGNIIPFYQKKLMWFVGLGLKSDGECSESILTNNSFNKLIWFNFNKNSIIKIFNFKLNLSYFKIHKRLKHYYYNYLYNVYHYISLNKKSILKKINYFKNDFVYYKTKSFNFNRYLIKINQFKIIIINFFFNLIIFFINFFFNFININDNMKIKFNFFFFFLIFFFFF